MRHGAGTMAHAAGADLKTVQEQLGHTSIVPTAGMYTSVLLELHFKVTEATARLVLQAAARNPGRRYRSKIGPPKSAAPDLPTGPEPIRPKRSRKGRRSRKCRASMRPTRHPRSKPHSPRPYGPLTTVRRGGTQNIPLVRRRPKAGRSDG
ncbi:hypothetical protein [Virgisporangium aurantiacum]|uniref:hypothetical protein n=1 Tax=Virgisporangium aurantiacum TaxID=175570 RepID=UPI0023B28DCF|nr:hypothetical protein [Virgisporangium aurantiacum]